MPRNQPLKFSLSKEDKTFLYYTFRSLTEVIFKHPESQKKARRDLVKLILKFTPGDRAIYLQEWERHVIVLWLLKLHNLAGYRDSELQARLRKIIDVLK